MTMKCTCKALVAFAGGIAMISSATVASPTTGTTEVVKAKKDNGAAKSVASQMMVRPQIAQARGVCDPECADVTGDGNVDLADLNAVLGVFGTPNAAGDANCDGTTDLADLNLVLAQFGTECGGDLTNDVPEGAISIECGGSAEADLTTAVNLLPEVPFGCGTGADTGTNTLWYSFVATNTAASVQTCNSAVGTDSVLSIYSGTPGSLTEIACGEDDCGDSGFNSLAVATGLTVGETYYVQVGAWSAGAVATYTVEVDCFEPEVCVTCDDATVIESEPILVDGDTDTVNGGCNTDGTNPPTEANLNLGDIVCGTASLYSTDTDGDGVPNALRDTDWYQFTLTEATSVEWEMTADGPGQVIIASWDGLDCANLGNPFIAGAFTADDGTGCQTGVVAADLPAGTYLAFAAYQGGSGNPNGSTLNYRAELKVGGQTPGACCDFDGNCVETVEADCDTFFTPDATCADVTCPAPIVCPDGAFIEGGGFGEELADGYVDSLNGGCNSTGPGQAPAVVDFVSCGDSWCGTSGNFLGAGGGATRDTDWYQFDVFADQDVTVEFEAQFEGLFGMLALDAGGICPATPAFIPGTATVAESGSFTVSLLPGSYIIFASTSGFEGVPANAPYTFSVTCAAPSPVACCFADGSCTDLLASDCATQGGSAQADVCANVTCPIIAANDSFEGALPVSCGDSFIADLNEASAGNDDLLFSCGIGTAHTNTLWYSFVATGTTATVATCVGNDATAQDTTIDIYAFDGSNLIEVGCGEDECGGSGFLTEAVAPGLTVGETYYFRVGAWSAAEIDAYNVTVTCN